MKDKKIIASVLFLSALLLISSVDFSLISKANTSSPELGYFSYSPVGEKGGAAIPASCESGYSHAGECYINDGLGTSIPTPPGLIRPTPQCPCESASNSCGMRNSGFGACGASCPIPSPSDSSCPAVSLLVTQTGTGFSGGSGSTGGASLENAEQTVNRGGRCSISWNASPATSCRITGGGINEALAVSGTYLTPPIQRTTIFQITCNNGPVVTATKNFTCKLNPTYQETGGSGTSNTNLR